MKKRLAAWLVLGIITVVAGLSLAITNEVTRDVIKKQAEQAEVDARIAVLSEAGDFLEIPREQLPGGDKSPLDGLFAGTTDGETVGHVGKVVVTGYGGPIEIIAGVLPDGTISGVNIGGADFAETPGLGAKARDVAFAEQFVGKKAPLKIAASGAEDADNTIDAIAAATITSRAVLAGVNRIASEVDAYLNPETPGGLAEGTTYTASQQGFKGPITVFVTVKDDGTISALTVGDDAFSETDGLGTLVREKEFTQQFVGKSLPVELDDIEAVAGATVSTKAVLAAINQAYEDKNIVVLEAPKPEGTTYTASQQGFKGPVTVFVTVKDDGTISALTVGDDEFNETDGLGTLVQEKEFTQQFVGKSLPVELGDIEAVAGATVSTKAVLAAINQAYEERNVAEATEAEDSIEPSEQPVAIEAPAASEVPDAPEAPEVPTDAIVEAFEGFKGPVAVAVVFDEKGAITFLKIGDDRFAETPGLGDKVLTEEFAQQFIGKAPPIDIKDIDAIAGATMTTRAVIDGINEAYSKVSVSDEIPEDAIIEAFEGYAGPVAVAVVFDEKGAITFLKIGDDRFAETPGLGDKVLAEEFAQQFIGKVPPIDIKDIDAIAGATMSTKAVIDGINEAHNKFSSKIPEDAIIEAFQGFKGPVAVAVVFDEKGAITFLKIGDDRFAETPSLGDKVLEEEFAQQFIGKVPPVDIKDIDAIAGATMSTQAVIDGINEAYTKHGK